MAAQHTMPERIGPYRLLEKIGEGGMGVVHLATDPGGRAVAVKLLRPGVDTDARRRLSREFEVMRRVRSPYVATVIDADVTGEVPYVVTRYVAGPSLDQLVAAAGPLRGQDLERLAWGLAEGLAAVHAAGVVHRDIKPGNVVIAGGVPVLIDFGIAHAPDATKITQTGMFMGTPGYLAPEVVEGRPSGPAADVHSWASTVAFAATGRPPFGTGSYETIFFRIVSGQPDLAGVPVSLLPVLTAALARDPAARPTAMRLSQECAALSLSETQHLSGMQHLPEAPQLSGPRWGGSVLDTRLPAGPPSVPPVPPRDRQAARPAWPGFRRLLSLLTMGIAVVASVLLPVAGVVASLLVILLLRAADLAHRGLTRRRAAQGARSSDVPIMIIKTPWSALRALAGCLAIAPLALTCAAAAAVVTIVTLHADSLPAAGGYAAGAFVACYGFGPGSAPPRRQLGRLYGLVTRGQLPAAVATLVLTVLAAATVAAAATQPHYLWPLTPGLAAHLTPLHDLIQRLQLRLPHA